MRLYRGISVSEGVAAGEALVLLHGEIQVPDVKIAASQREKEVTRLNRALGATRKDIEKMEDETRHRLGDLSRLLTVYQTFLDDATIVNPMIELIRGKSLAAQ